MPEVVSSLLLLVYVGPKSAELPFDALRSLIKKQSHFTLAVSEPACNVDLETLLVSAESNYT